MAQSGPPSMGSPAAQPSPATPPSEEPVARPCSGASIIDQIVGGSRRQVRAREEDCRRTDATS